MNRNWSLASAWVRIGVGICLFAGPALLVGSPSDAPVVVFFALATTAWPLARGLRAARGTALGPAVIWACVAVGLGLVAQAWAWSEPPASVRLGAGRWVYLSALATLAALISVLNARTPGGGAWAILMALLVLVFLIPWLEGPGLANPWTIFYWLLVVAGVTNFVPTRYGLAAAWLLLGFAVEFLGLTRNQVTPLQRGSLWSVFPWTLATALWTAEWQSRRKVTSAEGLERTWLWFRDHWGVVWALRVQERFNLAAERSGWPIRLGWFGIVPAPGMPDGTSPVVPEGAEATLKALLRRFAEQSRIDAAISAPCHPPGAQEMIK